MEIRGTIKRIGEIKTFPSGFQKREFVFITDETFPQTLSIEIHSQRIDIIDPFNEGDVAIIGINILGREWTSSEGKTKYFNSIVAWKITLPM